MSINRREFLLVTAAVTCGCASSGNENAYPTAVDSGPVDIGPASNFTTDGVYDQFRAAGVFLIRQHGKVAALSAVCTHRACPLRAVADGSFYCKCHGSTFDPQGKVTKGPAKRDLPALQITTAGDGHLIVTKPPV